MMRPNPTPTASFTKYGTVDQPVIGEDWVGVGDGVSDRSEAMAMERSSWKGSVVTSTTLAPCARQRRLRLRDVLVAVVAARLEDVGLGHALDSSRYIAPDCDSVHLSPGFLLPVTMISGAYPWW